MRILLFFLLFPLLVSAQVVDKQTVQSLKDNVIPELYQVISDGRFTFSFKKTEDVGAGEPPEANILLADLVTRIRRYNYKELTLSLRSINEKGEESAYTAEFKEANLEGQFFEKFQFLAPKQVQDYSFYTLRKADEAEDVFSVFSPLLNKPRILTATNRSDSLLNSAFALDDLEGWSGKPEWVTAVNASSGVWFAPPQANGSVSFKEGCDAWDFSDVLSRYFLGNQYLPTEGFTLRKLYRLELKQSDIFSRYGTQVLYIDPLTLTVLYKAVLDDSGSLQKLVFSGFSSEGAPTYTLINDFSRMQQSLASYIFGKRCEALPKGIDLNDLKLKPERSPKEAKKAN